MVVGTNGTLLTDKTVSALKSAGVQGVGLSLDAVHSASHDRFRGMPGSWENTVQAMNILKNQNLSFQIQVTVTKQNYDEIPGIITLAYEKGAKAVHVFFLVCTGRGERMTDITPEQYESMLRYLVRAEEAYKGRILVRARCAPHFLRVVQQENPDASVAKGGTSGCIAGRGYCRITPEGGGDALPLYARCRRQPSGW